MTIANRLREERQRVGLSQPALAAIVEASKSAIVSWERGTSAPTATALAAMAQAGFDALYILTGRRSPADPNTAVRSIEDDLAEIRRDILEPGHDFDGRMELRDYEEQKIEAVARRLRTYLENDAALMTPAQAQEMTGLLPIVSDPAQLAAFRAADFFQQRQRREHIRESLAGWFDASDDGPSPSPAGTAMNILATLALEYGVPVKLLVELVHELRYDALYSAALRMIPK